MSLKSIALAAAAVATLSGPALANTYFQFGEALDASTNLDLGLITAENAGTLEIYDERAGQEGALLGMTNLNAGANPDVRVNIGKQPFGDVIAVIKIDGEVVDTKKFDIN